MRYKFQMENGNIAEGNLHIAVKNHIAEIEGETPGDLAPAMKHLIEAYGGQLVKANYRKPKSKRTVNPVKWTEKEAAKEVTDLLKKAKEMNEGVTK